MNATAAAPRLTVVFDDPELYRRLKVRAAKDGVTLKALVEVAVRELLGDPILEAGGSLKPVDWDAYDRWQEEAERRDLESPDYPHDLSNVKKYLYGRPDHEPALALLAEEREEYGRR
jgi:hypothetical protein